LTTEVGSGEIVLFSKTRPARVLSCEFYSSGFDAKINIPEQPGSPPYRIEAEASGSQFSGTNRSIENPTEVEVRFMPFFDNRYIGYWIEAGEEWIFYLPSGQ